MKQLDMEFKNEIGKTKHMRLNYASQTLDETTVKTAMQTIADLKMFELEAVNPYATPIKAQYIERTVTPIFGGEAEAVEPVADADKHRIRQTATLNQKCGCLALFHFNLIIRNTIDRTLP